MLVEEEKFFNTLKKIILSSITINQIIYFLITQSMRISFNYCLLYNYVVSKSNHMKFLGLILEEKIYWEEHISFLSMKTSSGTFAISNLNN